MGWIVGVIGRYPAVQFLLHLLKTGVPCHPQLTYPIHCTSTQNKEVAATWIPPHECKRIIQIHWLPWDGSKMRIFIQVWLRPERRIVGTKTKVRAEVHSVCRRRTPDDTLVGRRINKIPDDRGGLCIKRPNRC